MTYLSKLAALVILFASPVKADVIIDVDTGGALLQYLLQAEQYNSDGTRVVIRGSCWSACTVFLGVNNVCAEPSASFHFHAAYTLREGERVKAPGATQIMIETYPEPIQQWIKSIGGLETDRWHFILGPDFSDWGVPAC